MIDENYFRYQRVPGKDSISKHVEREVYVMSKVINKFAEANFRVITPNADEVYIVLAKSCIARFVKANNRKYRVDLKTPHGVRLGKKTFTSQQKAIDALCEGIPALKGFI